MEDLKKLVADDTLRIQLHDRIAKNLQKLFEGFSGPEFKNDDQYAPEYLKKRIQKCEELIQELCTIQALLGFWGTSRQEQLFYFPIRSIAFELKNDKSNMHIKAAKLYSITLLFYYAGISAIASESYDKLLKLFMLWLPNPIHSHEKISIYQIIEFLNGPRTTFYHEALGYHHHKVPMSEHLFNHTREKFQSIFNFGSAFENYFDLFELLYSLNYIDQNYGPKLENVNPPIGRFGIIEDASDPYQTLVKEAEHFKGDWPVLMSGFFGRDYKRFKQVSDALEVPLKNFRW